MPQPSDTFIFGIRHHGPGSSRSLCKALQELQPDIILVEGPPDAAQVLPLLAHAEMTPPVALLVYRPEKPNQAVYYPFAIFSPEWQALHFGLSREIPVRFMDLPVAHRFALDEAAEKAQAEVAETPPSETENESKNETAVETPQVETAEPPVEEAKVISPRTDPLGWLAQAAGYSDGERWWEHMVEHRQETAGLFEAILEAMAALREQSEKENVPVTPEELRYEQWREAHMRQTIAQARKEGFKKIAVICGAWHGPALLDNSADRSKKDATLLKGLPKAKVETTWIPWTYGRLTYASGYGAGIGSPGWYHHLWETSDHIIIRWLTKVAHLLREQDLDVSSAHLIEAVRLTETLASLRGQPLPGLLELHEAVQSVLCNGDDLQLKLIQEKLVVSERLGEVPSTTPMIPLQQDLHKEQKRLRLPPEAGEKQLDLDLRKSTDLERSFLLHRLNLLGVEWGRIERVRGKSGTFHEIWRVRWMPEFSVRLIEAGVWGNTIHEATTAYILAEAAKPQTLPQLTELVEKVMLAELPAAVTQLVTRLQNEAAVTSDVSHLMEALPALANLLRYGSVRQINTAVVGHVVDGLVTRICIGLPGACGSLNDEAAQNMFKSMLKVNQAVALLQKTELQEDWYKTLLRLANMENLHGLIAGGCCRLLLDKDQLEIDEVARRMGLALSTASDPAQAANWVEGLLRDSGMLLIHDGKLWQVLDGWVCSLNEQNFITLLPLLRRTFATFAPGERRQLGEKVRHGKAASFQAGFDTPAEFFDRAQAEASLPLLAQILGVA